MNFLKVNINESLMHISSGYFISPTNWTHVKRNIDSFVLIIGLKGTAYIQQEDEQYQVNPGDALILLPHQTHFGYRPSEDSASYYWCHFYCNRPYIIDEARFTRELLIPQVRWSKYDDCDYILVPVFSSYPNIDRIIVFFNQLLHVANSNYYSFYGANYLLTLIMMELTQHTISAHIQKLKDDEINGKFMRILEWIRINIKKNLSVSDVAKEFDYNADYLSRMFKQKTGMTLLKYINTLKLSKAKEMLLSSNISIKEIAYKLGFTDEKYFMKLFKNEENLTPTQFRNSFFYTHMNNY